MNYRRSLITAHVVLAAFFLPVALMFAVTGALYTVSIKGSYRETTHTITLAEPAKAELGAMVSAVEQALAGMGKSAPTGSAALRSGGADVSLDWTGANRDISLKTKLDSTEAALTVRDTTPYRRLVQLHKAKGSAIAKGISVLWAVGLVLMFVSGMAIAWGAASYRRLAIVASAAGVLTFVAYVAIG